MRCALGGPHAWQTHWAALGGGGQWSRQGQLALGPWAQAYLTTGTALQLAIVQAPLEVITPILSNANTLRMSCTALGRWAHA